MTSLFVLTQAGFIATTFFFYGLFAFILWKGLKKANFSDSKKKRILSIFVIALTLWLGTTAILAYAGVFSNFEHFPPPFFLLLIIPLITIIAVTTRRGMLEILQNIPQHQLIYLQSFRIIVEALLWMLFVENLLPVQMTFEGRNIDVLSGLSAIVMAFLISKRKVSNVIAIAWNVACLGILLNIVVIAILSTPTPLRIFMNEPANTIVTMFPIVWLPAVLVPLAYGLHILSIRQLLQKDTATHD